MYTIGRLAKEFNLSRSTLLYYDSIGLLKPSVRTENKYRQYTDRDKEYLEKICLYRQMGIALEDIKKILYHSEHSIASILEFQLKRLSEEIRILRQQQFAIVKLLQNTEAFEQAGMMDKRTWTSLLRSSGLDDDAMHQWHVEFERLSPRAHHEFLVSLGISDEEISSIRELSGK